jgi:hypothetical protein
VVEALQPQLDAQHGRRGSGDEAGFWVSVTSPRACGSSVAVVRRPSLTITTLSGGNW